MHFYNKKSDSRNLKPAYTSLRAACIQPLPLAAQCQIGPLAALLK